jgi:choline dehydrogenase
MRYDYIIVGAGAGGAIIASRLTENPGCSVLLLEAGKDYPDLEHLPDDIKYGHGVNTFWQAQLPPHNTHRRMFVARATDRARPMLIPRGTVIGGSTSVNAQIFLRGVPEDYDNWASMGNTEWSFQKLMPYFRKLEGDADFHDDFHGSDGPIIVKRYKPHEWLQDEVAFYKACLDSGFPDCPDHNDPDSTGVGPTPFNRVNRVRWSTAIGYLNHARHRLNLVIKANCLVRRVLFDGRRAMGVEVENSGEKYIAEGGEKYIAEGNEIIVCGGAIGSPQTLMLSGIGPAGQLKNLGIPVLRDLPGVGQNLRDHPQVYLLWRTRDSFQQDVTAPRMQFTLRYTARGSQLRNDMLIHPVSAANVDMTKGGDPTKAVGVGMICTLDLAAGAGELRLLSDDPRIQPYLNYNYLTDPFDRQRLRKAVHICLKLAEHREFRDIIQERIQPADADLESDDTLDEWLMREVRTSHHISGTCKMGPASDSMAVVDQYGRVHGLERLRVADASIMPDCIRANTNVTTMMIGERIAASYARGNRDYRIPSPYSLVPNPFLMYHPCQYLLVGLEGKP